MTTEELDELEQLSEGQAKHVGHVAVSLPMFRRLLAVARRVQRLEKALEYLSSAWGLSGEEARAFAKDAIAEPGEAKKEEGT